MKAAAAHSTIQANKRREKDVMKLILSRYEVALVNDKTNELFVKFAGPKDSPYEGVQYIYIYI